MASPAIVLTLEAVERGFLTLEDFDGSERWWAGHRIAIHRAEQLMDADVQQAKLTALASRTSDLSDPSENAYKLFRERRKPWIVANEATTGDAELDQILSWYLIAKPEALEAAGVDVGALVSE